MPVKDIDELFKNIKKKFDKNSNGWKVLSDIDPRGNKDLFISKDSELWQVKAKTVNPMAKIAKGFHVRNLDDEIQDMIEEKGQKGDKLLFSMLIPQENNAIIAQGIESFQKEQSKCLKSMLAEKNKNMERDLTHEVEREFEKRHPMRDLFM